MGIHELRTTRATVDFTVESAESSNARPYPNFGYLVATALDLTSGRGRIVDIFLFDGHRGIVCFPCW